MSEGPWWILPLVVVGSILIILYVSLFSLLPIPPSEKLVATGLFLNVCGAVVVLIPDLVGVDKLFEPTERIERIEEAQNGLFLKRDITPKSDGYTELVEIIMEVAGVTDIEHFPRRVSISPSGKFDIIGEQVMFHHEKYDTPPIDEIGRYINHSSLLDSRISEHIEDLRSRGHQLGFALGIVLLLAGFLSQFAAIIL